MIVHRFMSEGEYRKLIGGKALYNNTSHKSKRYRTTSVGFCFFREEPDEAIHWLSGVVDVDWCVTMEVSDDFLVKSVGMYADNSRCDIRKTLEVGMKIPMVRKEEYCRCRYSLADVKFLGATQKYRNEYPSRKEQRRITKEFLRNGKI